MSEKKTKLENSYLASCGGRIEIGRNCLQHLNAHPDVVEYLQEAIGKLILPKNGEFLKIAVPMGRVIGKKSCIRVKDVTPDESATFAWRPNRNRPSRVIVGEGEDCETLAILAFAKTNKGAREILPRKYILVTAWIGGIDGHKEPWDKSLKVGSEEQKNAMQFWCEHALVYDPVIMGEILEATWNSVVSGDISEPQLS